MDSNAVLFANEAFYLAFSQCDFEAMAQFWSRESPVLCVHPGWPALTEYAAILESWRRILRNATTGIVTPHHARVFLYGPMATVVCYEEIQGTLLLACNMFVMEEGEIRIVKHHSSHCSNPPPPENKGTPPLQ